MPHSISHKSGSLVSLLALLVNLLSPFTTPGPAKAETLEPTESGREHYPPAILVDSAAPVPAATGAEAAIPAWFTPPAVTPIDYSQTAGLTLSKPAAIVDLPAAPPRPGLPSLPDTPASAPANGILPGWFTDTPGNENTPTKDN